MACLPVFTDKSLYLPLPSRKMRLATLGEFGSWFTQVFLPDVHI